MRRFGAHRWWLGGLAAAGAVVSHPLAYRIAHDHHAHGVGHHTPGLGLAPLVTALAVGGLVATPAGHVTRSLPGSGNDRDRRWSGAVLAGTWCRLAVLGGASWLLLEGLERVATGASLTGLLAEAPVLVGLVAQAAVALAGAIVLLLLSKAVAALRRRRRAPSWRRPPPRPLTDLLVPRPRLAAAAASPRAPPA